MESPLEPSGTDNVIENSEGGRSARCDLQKIHKGRTEHINVQRCSCFLDLDIPEC